MRYHVCQMIDEITGTKSTKIMELINRKLQKDKEKMLSSHVADKKLKDLEKLYFSAEAEMKKAKEELDKRKEELDLEWSGGKVGRYDIVEKCRISKEDYEILQNAQDLFSIGKRKEAQEIWAGMIEKHKLFKNGK
jgi:uncharacterized protein (DUF342 family)